MKASDITAILNTAAALIADALNQESKIDELKEKSSNYFRDAADQYYAIDFRGRDLAANGNGDAEKIKTVEHAILLATYGGKLALQYDNKACKLLSPEEKKARSTAKTSCATYLGRIRKYLCDLEAKETGVKLNPKTGLPKEATPTESESASDSNTWSAMLAAAAAFRQALGNVDPKHVVGKPNMQLAMKNWINTLKALQIDLD